MDFSGVGICCVGVDVVGAEDEQAVKTIIIGIRGVEIISDSLIILPLDYLGESLMHILTIVNKKKLVSKGDIKLLML